MCKKINGAGISMFIIIIIIIIRAGPIECQQVNSYMASAFIGSRAEIGYIAGLLDWSINSVAY
jgi:hypothetical protein